MVFIFGSRQFSGTVNLSGHKLNYRKMPPKDGALSASSYSSVMFLETGNEGFSFSFFKPLSGTPDNSRY